MDSDNEKKKDELVSAKQDWEEKYRKKEGEWIEVKKEIQTVSNNYETELSLAKQNL